MASRRRTYPRSVERAAELLRLLADPTRFHIIRLLAERRLRNPGTAKPGVLLGTPVYALADRLGMSHSAVSHQLGVLEAGGIVTGVRDGQTIRYRIARTSRGRMAVRITRIIAAAV